MPELSNIEDTLFVPMLGRIYASEHFPKILNDQKALELKNKLPENLRGQNTQTQYTYLASAVRSTNMDRYIKDFIEKNKNGVIVQLGCGLETTYYRNNGDDFPNLWFEVDLPEVIEYRKTLLAENKNEKYIAADGFSDVWIKKVRELCPDSPILVTASGLFYYFSTEKVVNLMKMLQGYGSVEIVFDTVNYTGMSQMSKYMEQVGHEDAPMYFYVNNGLYFANEIGAELIKEEAYYAHTVKRGLKFMTFMSMKVSDMFMMVKMEHMKLN